MRGKKILLISPQAWGTMFVAKHHYAVELSRCGHEVYFLNPPSFGVNRFVKVDADHSGHPGLIIIHHGTSLPLWLRFKFRALFNWLMKAYVNRLIGSLGQQFDIVWCFEPNLYSNLEWFGAKKKIYHPVDELFYAYQFKPGKNADLVISVTHEILSKFHDIKGKKLFINHGISREFADAAGESKWEKGLEVVVGYAGNLLRPDIDFATLKKCILRFPDVKFVFWGNYQLSKANLAGVENEEITSFISFLQHSTNVTLKGAVGVKKLIEEYRQVDIFLICYDIDRDQSHGTNYHKVMEFLSTGRVIVSNNITTYKDCDLLRMCSSRSSNNEFPDLLEDTIRHLDEHNADQLQLERKKFAQNNTYQHHVVAIEHELFYGQH